MIKREMITMLCYDNYKNPPATSGKKAANLMSQCQSYLDNHPYSNYEDDELAAVSFLVKST